MTPDTDVPDGESPAAVCPYCERPFTSERLETIHVGERHDDVWSAEERAAYEDAVRAERDDLFVYHLKVVGALVAVYAALFVLYLVVLSTGAGAGG